MATPGHDEKWANAAARVFGLDGRAAAWQGEGVPSRPFKVMVEGREVDYGARLAQLRSYAMTRGHDYAGPLEAGALSRAGGTMRPVHERGYKIELGSMLATGASGVRYNPQEYVQAIYQAVEEGKIIRGQMPPESLVVVLFDTGKPVAVGARLADLARPDSAMRVSDEEAAALHFAGFGSGPQANPEVGPGPEQDLPSHQLPADYMDPAAASVYLAPEYVQAYMEGHMQGYLEGLEQNPFSHQPTAEYADFTATPWISGPEMGYVPEPVVQEPISYRMPADSGYGQEFAAASGNFGPEHVQEYVQGLVQGYTQGPAQHGYADLSVTPQSTIRWPSEYFPGGAALNHVTPVTSVTPAEALRAPAGPLVAPQDQYLAPWAAAGPGSSNFAGYAGQLQPDLNGRDQSHVTSHDLAVQRQIPNFQQGAPRMAR